MTVTVKLITEQTTNQLVDSVNKAQTQGWFPVCGVVCFNARYTQLMANDSNGTEVAKCNYFIVDSEDGLDFAARVNKLVALNTGAVCLSPVQYEQARYIQAWGDDSLHHGNGGGGGGNALKWYTEDALKRYPIIDVDPNFSQIGLGNSDGGYVQLLFRTGGDSAGYIMADDGTMSFVKSDGTRLQLNDSGMLLNVDNRSILNANVYPTNPQITVGDTAVPLIVKGKDLELNASNNATQLVMHDAGFNTLIRGMSVFNSDGEYTNLISGPSSLSLAPDFAGMSSVAGALELSETRGIKLYTNGSVNSIIEANDTQSTFGDLFKPTTVNGDSIILNGALGSGSVEIDANAVRIKRGSNNAFSISNSGGALTWNSMIRCAWNADGWNVSHDTGVAFSSRATYSVMQAKSGARVETNATGTTIISSDATASQSKCTLANAGMTVDTHGEYLYNIDGKAVFFSSGDITKLTAERMYVELDDGAETILVNPSYVPTVDNSVATKGYVDSKAAGLAALVRNYDAWSVPAQIHPGSDIYRSGAETGEKGVTIYAPTEGKRDIIIMSPGGSDIVVSAPENVQFSYFGMLSSTYTQAAWGVTRYIATSDTVWMVVPLR